MPPRTEPEAEEETVFELVLTIVVLLGVATAILLFERPRARRIERDLRDQARERRGSDPDTEVGTDDPPGRR